jgi:molecular chaperone DnaK
MKAIGIDLGTTNSVGAQYEEGKAPTTLPSSRPDGLVPSVVVYRKPSKKNPGSKGETLVGQAAVDYARLSPTDTIWGVKRLMGRWFAEDKVTQVKERVNYRIEKAPCDDPGVCVVMGDKSYTPVEISAIVLKQIKENAERALGQPITHAVITVPAYFEERQRAATRQAGELAGFIVKKIIDEPSAAAIAYGIASGSQQRQRLLVFDLGGGTFDVSIIQSMPDPQGKNHFEVLEIGGDPWLGGDDFDREIIEEIIRENQSAAAEDLGANRRFQMEAKQLAERAKIALSNALETSIDAAAVFPGVDDQPGNIEMVLTRTRFDELIQPYVDRAIGAVNGALQAQGLAPEDIDMVLMVGGSTLVPLVYQSVVNRFGASRVKQVANPFHVVASGAAILATTMRGIQCPNPVCGHINDESENHCTKCGEPLAAGAASGDVSVNEVTAMSFGIAAVQGNQSDVFKVIIPKGISYPLTKSKMETFLTTADNSIRIEVYEGNNPVASRNGFQGAIELGPEDFKKDEQNVPANSKVEVAMNYTRDREITVTLRVLDANIQKEVKLKRDRAAQPPQSAQEGKSRATLEQVIKVAEYFQTRYTAFMDAGERQRLETEIQGARQAVGSNLSAEIDARLQALILALDQCGLASLLFMAERLQAEAVGDRAEKMASAIAQIKKGYLEGRLDQIENMIIALRATIAAEVNTRRAGGAQSEDFRGLPRVLER